MLSLISNNLVTFISYYSVLITLIITPFSSKDAVIVPKVALVLFLLFIITPIFFNNIKQKEISVRKAYFLFGFLIFAILVFLILIFSAAPIEQQLYGRGGRGLGLFTIFTACMVLITVSFFGEDKSKSIIKGLVISAFFSSSYSLLQSYGVDFYEWETRTNGVIGTLGNPNFQASFAAMAVIPTLVLFWKKDLLQKASLIPISIFYLIVLFRNNSTQGYLGLIIALSVFVLFYSWYRNKLFFWSILSFSSILGFLTVIAMINKGPFSQYFYKISIQSRGDFWRSAIETAQSNPLLGIGIDSFGDFFLKYRDETAVSHPWAEFTDNAHNYFLELAATGGFLLATLFVTLQVFIFYCIYSHTKRQKSFDPKFTAMVSAWSVYLAQSFISPGNISIILWGSIISGWIISTRIKVFTNQGQPIKKFTVSLRTRSLFTLSIVVAIAFAYPYFRADQMQFKAMKSGDGDLAIQSAKMFPESTTRYAVIIRGLYDSGLYSPALELSRDAVRFNPNSANLWALILINPSAPLAEREAAKLRIIELDPLNLQARNFNLIG
jgi:O-antigen ligase